MQIQVVYTFPFVFPDFPKMPFSFSSLQKGPDGLFGVAIEPVIDYYKDEQETLCSSFEINMVKRSVLHYPTRLPYSMIYHIQLLYDQSESQWMIAMETGAFKRPLDVYRLPQNTEASWEKIFAANSLDQEYQSEKGLVIFWQHDDNYPFLFCEIDAAQMYDGDICWTRWKSLPSSPSSFHHLDTSYTWMPYIDDEGFLLFTCRCIYNEALRSAVYRKMGPGQWHWYISAYKHDGTLIQQNQVPEATMPVREFTLAKDDFINWLKLHMSVSAGPPTKSENKQTCIAALVMQDVPGFRGITTKRFSAVSPQDIFEPKGGLYWVDLQGNILQHDASLVGEQISICVCGEMVIGTHLHNGERFLWTWFPSKESGRTVYASFSSEAQRVTLVATEGKRAGNEPFFWCLEEYEQGIRVVQRECEQLRELQAVWCEGIRIPDPLNAPSPYLADKKVQGIAAYQDTLLVLGVNQEKQLQLLQFR